MKFKRKPRQDIDVNMMPLIDVIFLLLIFFMVSTTFTKDSRLGLTLPKSEIGEEVKNIPNVEVIIDADGVYKVNDIALVDNNIAALKLALSEQMNAYKDRAQSDSGSGLLSPSLTITADASTAHQHVINAMDVAGQLGFSKLSITTLKQSE